MVELIGFEIHESLVFVFNETQLYGRTCKPREHFKSTSDDGYREGFAF